MSVSLDGFVCGPNGEFDWQARSRDEGGRAWIAELLARVGLHAMGSRSFLGMARFWSTSDDVLAAPMNDIPKAVFTRQPALDLRALPGNWAEAEVISGDLATEMTRLKSEAGKDILAQGGAGFAQSLVATGLIDEYRLIVHPVVLGAGVALFAQLPRPLDLELRGTTLFRSGTVAHIYRPISPPSA